MKKGTRYYLNSEKTISGIFYGIDGDEYLYTDIVGAQLCQRSDGCTPFYSEMNHGEVPTTPPYYDNTKGSLYKVAQDRNWNAYLFDVVKRLERGGKKDPLKQEIEKSIAVLQIWLNEL